MKRLYYILPLFLLISCQEEFEPEIDVENKLVVMAEVAPKKEVVIHLSSTLNSGDMQKQISDAHVHITGNDEEYVFNHKKSNNDRNISTYRNSFIPFRPGVPYSLEIEHKDYPTIMASTIIPEVYCFESTAVKMKETSRKNSNTVIRLNLNFDLGNVEEYEDKYFQIVPAYFLNGFEVHGGDTTWSLFTETSFIDSDQIISLSAGQRDYVQGVLLSGSELIESDGILELDLEIVYPSANFSVNSIQLELRNLSEEYYTFHKQVSKLDPTTPIENIFQEPVVGYSNVVNGYGQFTSYNYCLEILNF